MKSCGKCASTPAEQPVSCRSFLVTNSTEACRAACDSEPACKGFVHVAAGQKYSMGLDETKKGPGSCWFVSNTENARFKKGSSCFVKLPQSSPSSRIFPSKDWTAFPCSSLAVSSSE